MANSDSSGVISFIFFFNFCHVGPRCSSVVASWALQFQHELSCPEACGILVPQPGIEPASPALEGQFLTYGPPGKSQKSFYLLTIYLFLYTTHPWLIYFMSRSLYLWTPFTHCTYPAPRNHFYVNSSFYKQKFHLDYQFKTFLSLKNLFWYPEIITHVKFHVTWKFKHREQRNMKNSISATCYPEKQKPGTISSVTLGAGTAHTHTHTHTHTQSQGQFLPQVNTVTLPLRLENYHGNSELEELLQTDESSLFLLPPRSFYAFLTCPRSHCKIETILGPTPKISGNSSQAYRWHPAFSGSWKFKSIKGKSNSLNRQCIKWSRECLEF